MMVVSKNITVSSRFDSGDFTGSFSVHAKSKNYDIYDTCIQKVFDLSFDDFKVLEVLIAGTVEQYLTAKGLDNARSRI